MQEVIGNIQEEEDDDYYFSFFEDEFLAALDSWYSSDIKCCEKCYDDFIENWPIAIDRLPDSYLIDVNTFYAGSKLQFSYTKEQYENNLYRVKCPRCGAGIESNFWAFNFDFSEFENLEGEFWELKNLIKQTPFLVLKNKLANKTFDLLEELSMEIIPKPLTAVLYRGRIIEKQDVKKKDLLPPPGKFTNEGRYNHIGVPVVYAASKALTCFNELRRPAENLYVAEFVVSGELKLMNFTAIEEEKNDLLKAIIMSSLASAKANDQAIYKPEYYFTRYIADCCRYLGLDGIIYPSAQVGEGKNYVFFDVELIKEDNIRSISKYTK